MTQIKVRGINFAMISLKFKNKIADKNNESQKEMENYGSKNAKMYFKARKTT
jgi:hypothetical protein